MTYTVPPARTSNADASTTLEHNDLDQLRRQAKELLKALRPETERENQSESDPKAQPDPSALELARKHYRGELPSQFQLSDTQLIIARHHGYASWAQLRAAVDAVNLRRLLAAMEREDIATVSDLLRKRPELVHLDTAQNNEHRPLHYAVLKRHEPLVRILMKAGADAHKGIYPHREATTAFVIARERGYTDIVTAIEEEEQFRREDMSCPNASVCPEQDTIAEHIRAGRHAEAIAALAAAPSLIHACDREGATPLHIACQEGALDVIDWLLEQRANPRKSDLAERTPLERAIHAVQWRQRHRARHFPAVAQRLIAHGAPVTPLVAAALGDTDALGEFHRRDAAALNLPREWGQTSLLATAVTFGQIDTLRLLLRFGLDPDQPQRVANVEEEIISRGGPLWLASAFAEYEMARVLLKAGADPNAMSYASGTPLDRAYGIRNQRMIDQLVAAGARARPGTLGSYRDVDAARALLAGDPPPSEDDVLSLLWSAACGGSPEIVAMCLPLVTLALDDVRWHSITVQPLRIWLHSPIFDFHDQFDRGTYPECLRLILAHGVDLTLSGRFGDTLLHNIAAEGKTWGIVVMTEEERSAFTRITLEESAARIAAGRPGVDFSRRDHLLKSTPLGWAARWGRTEMVRQLLDYGAPASEPDAEPWATPLAWANKMGHEEIASILEKKAEQEKEN